MSIIIILFMLPLGIVFYFFDKKTKQENRALLTSYVHKIISSDLSKRDTLLKIDQMYYKNGYSRIELNDTELIVEKKHFNLGVLFIFFGITSYFRIVFYIIYYRYLLQPEQLRITLSDTI